jgi:hypothetical protein
MHPERRELATRPRPCGKMQAEQMYRRRGSDGANQLNLKPKARPTRARRT